MRSTLIRSLVSVTFVLCYVLPGNAQSVPPIITDQVSSGTGGDFEKIDLSNAGVNLSIPLITVKGRGIGFHYGLNYTSKIWYIDLVSPTYVWFHQPSWTVTNNAYRGSNWAGYSSSVIDTCYDNQYHPLSIWAIYNPKIRFPDGSQRMFPRINVDVPYNCTNPPAYADYDAAYSSDLTALMEEIYPDGTAPGRDTNGNQVTVSLVGAYTYDYTDSTGRVVLRETLSTDLLPTTLTLADGRTISLIWDTLPLTTAFANPAFAYNCTSGCSHKVLKTITLPNSRSWNFEYATNSYGQLTKVILPSGGYIRYEYALQSQFVFDSVAGSLADALVVSGRFVSPDGVVEHPWTYTYSTTTEGGDVTERTTTQIDPHNDSEVHTFKNLTPGNPSYYESDVEFRQGTSTILKRIHKDWACDFVPQQVETGDGFAGISDGLGNCRVTDEMTTLLDIDPAITKQVHFDYDTSLSDTYPGFAYFRGGNLQFNNYTTTFGNITKILEYNWGTGGNPGALLRQTENTYLTVNPANGNIDYSQKTTHIVNKLARRVVRDGQGLVVAETQYEYDGGSLLATSGVPQHDYVNYSPNNKRRGNLTKTRQWLNTTGTWLETSYSYDDLGNRRSSTDPRNNTTLFGYADNYDDSVDRNSQAYLTQINYPSTGTPAVSHIEKKGWYYLRGLLYQDIDQNNQATTYGYDIMERLATVGYADGGQTSYAYYDVPPLSVVTTRKLDESRDVVTTSTLDGFRRVIQAQLDSDPEGVVFTDTSYDSLGRVMTVSNPYRNLSEVTYGITTTAYDALGRARLITHPDQSTTTFSYSGNCETFTDEAGKSRKSIVDAAGRIVQVIEDPVGLGYQTIYSYDALDNLTQVWQGTQTRVFAYDSLGRLTGTQNPESGTITYDYDGNGNVLTKTDVRGTITYEYDGLNRLKHRGYTDGTAPVTYSYDQNLQTDPADPNVNYPIGTLTQVSSSVSSSVFRYDAMGRVQASMQTTNEASYGFLYGYNLAGGMTSESYPTGRVVTTGYDSAGRVSSVSSGAKSYASNVIYTAGGAASRLQLGNGLIEQTCFNSRLQPEIIRLRASAAAQCGQAFDSADKVYLGFSYGSPGGNNGNITAQTISLPGLSLAESYGYDALNRISSFNEAAGWWQTYESGRYGNRLVTGGHDHDSTSTPQSFDDSTNKITGGLWSFKDPPATGPETGNLTRDGAGDTMTYNLDNLQTAFNGASYQYDGEGHRVTKYAVGVTTVFVYNAFGQLIAEYGSSSEPADTKYLTADHLGSTRVITDDAQATKARYDYLPFGGEIPAGVAGRTTEMGYTSVADSTTQRFSGKERDAESNLDYFGARYFSGAQGRFTSPDPLLNSGRPGNPQTWNRYSYALNNPLRIVDPTGLYNVVSHCTSDQRDYKACVSAENQGATRLRKGIEQLTKAVANMKEGPEKQRLQASLKALGTAGDDNNVFVSFRATGDGSAATTGVTHNPTTDEYSYDVTFDPRKIGSTDMMGVDAAHEGTHVADFATEESRTFKGSILSEFSLEYRGYQSSVWAASALGMPSISFTYENKSTVLWNGSWGAVDKNITGFVTSFHDKNGKPTHPETKPHDPWFK